MGYLSLYSFIMLLREKPTTNPHVNTMAIPIKILLKSLTVNAPIIPLFYLRYSPHVRLLPHAQEQTYESPLNNRRAPKDYDRPAARSLPIP